MGTAHGRHPAASSMRDYAPQRIRQLPGTSHMSIVDDNGEVVSMTTTVEFVFGSEMMAKGFFLNNQLTDFSFEPELDGEPVANAPAPGKRPMSAMSPTIVFGPDGKFKIALGSPGGPIIIDYVAGALIHMLDGGATPQEAAAPAAFGQSQRADLLEKGHAALEALKPELEAMGHNVVQVPLNSGLHIIEQVKGGYIGGADVRRDGNVRGD